MGYTLHWRLGQRGMHSTWCGHAGAQSAPLGTTMHYPALYAGNTIRVQGEPGGGSARRAWPHERAAGWHAHLAGRKSSTGVASIARPARLPRRHNTIFQFIASASEPPLRE